ncbi:Chromatin structure-remodeling complex subunit RSC1 [Lachnellula suecica]|uniref:Chromatin structure-remodeling complex subunit RSC1 n=1 Tax=Lachnellula suecica TaxID=602035 RepID=A0A8T9C8B3_9HELO|nr:Chromatin structure-remodeling complex subunit RSC1 [Lachnellula suecica]
MSSAEPQGDTMMVDVKAEETAGGESNATVAAHPGPTHLAKQELEQLDSILKHLTDYRDEDGHDISLAFQRMLNKRNFPAYFEIIKEPIAFSTIRSKILKKQYRKYTEFIRDFALICHNAMVYNRPSSEVYQDAVVLQNLFKEELQKLVEKKVLTEEEAQLPDLGEIPPADPSPPPEPEDEEAESEHDEDEDEEDEEDDETDDDRPRRGRKRGRRSSAGNKREGRADDGSKEDPEAQKKRGRPPKVHTPMEARINTLLKGLRKFKNPGGDLKILHFEKMPDKSVMPEYYQEIKNPIAMDLIKRKAKRKKYQSVDLVLKDLDLMFENAKSYNLEDSQVYRDAVDLQKEARIIADQEKKKPDSDFADEDGRLPLSEILYNNEIWKVGDWVHIANPNDVTKPIVAQIYRTWQDTTGQKWINAVWYYRPEQTVHRHEKHFFENEVVKTGQYRDHKIEEVVDRCFVMFFTRYNKGRPRGFPADKEVYVCEARYNEEKHKLNKIKTWASCLPDEVREKDYEMDLFDVPRKMKKVPSPIKHLLREDASEDDPVPKPTWGVQNAPPIVGAVHKRPRESNNLCVVPSPVTGLNTIRKETYRCLALARAFHSLRQWRTKTLHRPLFCPRPSPSPAPLTQQHSYGSSTSASHAPLAHTPGYQPQPNYNQYNAASTPSQHSNSLAAYNLYQSSGASAPVRTVAPAQAAHTSSTNQYNPPRAVEVYTLADQANAAIPAEIRSQFHTDEYGKVIFFTAPPLDANPIPKEAQHLGHSLRYLADKARNKNADEQKRKAREAELEVEATERVKRMKGTAEGKQKWLFDQKLKALETWESKMENSTDDLYKGLYGDNWKEKRESDLVKLATAQEKAHKEKKELELWHKSLEKRKEVAITGFRF